MDKETNDIVALGLLSILVGGGLLSILSIAHLAIELF